MINKEIIFKIIKSKRFLDIILPIFCIALVASLSYLFIKGNYFIFTVLTSVLVIGAFILSQFWSPIKDVSFKKFLFWLTIISAFAGTAFLIIPFGSFHLFLFRVLLPFFLFVIVLGVLLRGRLFVGFKKIKLYLLFLAIWLSYAILGLVWASSKSQALKQIYFLFIGLALIFLIISYLKTLKDLKSFYFLWLIFLVFLMGIGLWEMFTGNRLPSSGYFGTIYQKTWPTAVFNNTNDFASFLALSIPFIWAWARYSRGGKLKWLVWIMLFAGVFFLLHKTSSRINILAVALEAIFILFFLLTINKKIKILFVIGIIAILVFIFYPQFFMGPLNFFKSLTDHYSLTYGSVAGRIKVIKNSLDGLFDSFGFGVGAGNTPSYIASSARYPIIGGILSPHNWWIEILADYGIFIFVGYLLFYFSLIHNFWRIWHRINNRWEKIICETLLLVLIGFSLSSIGPSSIMELKYQWMLFGFALAFLNYYRLKYPVIKNSNSL